MSALCNANTVLPVACCVRPHGVHCKASTKQPAEATTTSTGAVAIAVTVICNVSVAQVWLPCLSAILPQP
jgi:hypothetical protein